MIDEDGPLIMAMDTVNDDNYLPLSIYIRLE